MDGKKDVIALLYLMKSVKLKQDSSQSRLVVELPGHFARAAGILKYMRESTNHGLTFDPQSETPAKYQIKCEYCGQEVSPWLDELCLHDSKEETLFCCKQWDDLYRLLLKMRAVWEGKSDDIPTTNDSTASPNLVYRRKKEKMSMFLMDATKEAKSETRLFEDYMIEMAVRDIGGWYVKSDLCAKKAVVLNWWVVTTCTSTHEGPIGSNVMSFRLSCPSMGSWVKLPESERERKANLLDTGLYKEEISFSICNHEPLDFGLCHHQDAVDFVNKYYPSDIKFLLVLDDGSAQVFYPSGLLAILVIVTTYGRVCIVYDDAPGRPIRALFQSDGKGTCYHPNGNIWLIINKHGGQCLDPDGARVRRWTWHNPLRPIFLFINKSIGIRLLGKQQIFVSFLANSRQAKFNVGAWCHKGNCKEVKISRSLAKDELIALAFKVKTKLLIQKLHRCLCTPSHPRVSNAALAPHLNFLAQKLLKAGKKVNLGEEDRDFLQSCLQECL